METAHEVSHEIWDEYLDAVNRELLDSQVSIEFDGSREVADTQPLAFRSLTYDRRGDVIELSLATGAGASPHLVRHVVLHPQRVAVDSQTMLAPMTIALDGGDGRRTLVRFEREPQPTDVY